MHTVGWWSSLLPRDGRNKISFVSSFLVRSLEFDKQFRFSCILEGRVEKHRGNTGHPRNARKQCKRIILVISKCESKNDKHLNIVMNYSATWWRLEMILHEIHQNKRQPLLLFKVYSVSVRWRALTAPVLVNGARCQQEINTCWCPAVTTDPVIAKACENCNLKRESYCIGLKRIPCIDSTVCFPVRECEWHSGAIPPVTTNLKWIRKHIHFRGNVKEQIPHSRIGLLFNWMWCTERFTSHSVGQEFISECVISRQRVWMFSTYSRFPIKHAKQTR